MSDNFAIVLKPFEASLIFESWPDDEWLVAHSLGHWTSSKESDLFEAVNGAAVWPPMLQFRIAEIDAYQEVEMLLRIMAQQNADELFAVPHTAKSSDTVEFSIDDIEWS